MADKRWLSVKCHLVKILYFPEIKLKVILAGHDAFELYFLVKASVCSFRNHEFGFEEPILRATEAKSDREIEWSIETGNCLCIDMSDDGRVTVKSKNSHSFQSNHFVETLGKLEHVIGWELPKQSSQSSCSVRMSPSSAENINKYEIMNILSLWFNCYLRGMISFVCFFLIAARVLAVHSSNMRIFVTRAHNLAIQQTSDIRH